MKRKRLPTSAEILKARCRRAFADQKRRARKDGVVLRYNAADLELMATRYNGLTSRCSYCQCVLGPDDVRFDHMQPIAQGGRHDVTNLCVVCPPCNLRKGRLRASEYRQLLALVGSWHPASAEDLFRRLTAGGKVYMGARRQRL